MELLGDVGPMESCFGPFGDGVSFGARYARGLCQCTIGSKIILDTPDGTPRFEAQLEAFFGLFGDSANLDTRLVHSLRRTYQRLKNPIGHTRWNSYMTWVMWNVVSVCLHARQVHGLCQMYLRLRNRFGRTRWYSLVMRLN
jgi:hypothetical protein